MIHLLAITWQAGWFAYTQYHELMLLLRLNICTVKIVQKLQGWAIFICYHPILVIVSLPVSYNMESHTILELKKGQIVLAVLVQLPSLFAHVNCTQSM